MKLDRLLAMLTSLALLCASTGCARWTLWPNSETPSPQPGAQAAAQPKGPKSLLQAVGLDRSAKSRQQAQIAARKQQQQQANNDLKHLDPALALARLAERQGEPSEARRQYRRYIDKNPSHPLPHHRLGVMAARESKFQEAEAHMQRAAQLAPPTAELLSDMGYLCYLQDRLQEAEHLLQQAHRLEPSNQTVNNNLANVMADKGDFDNSLRYFRKVNDEAEARANLAYTHSQQGNLEKARQEYLRALTLDNTLTSAAKALVQVEEARKREQAAISQYQAAMGDELIDGHAQAYVPQARPMPGRNAAPPREVARAIPSTNSYPTTPHQAAVAPAAHRVPQNTVAQGPMLMQVPPPSDQSALVPPPRRLEAPTHSVPSTTHGAVRQVNHTEPATASLSSPAFVGNQAAGASATATADASWDNAWKGLSRSPTQAQPTAVETQPRPQADAFELLGDRGSRFAAPQRQSPAGSRFGLSDEGAPSEGADETSKESGGISISIGDN